jgi:hypothetical protein
MGLVLLQVGRSDHKYYFDLRNSSSCGMALESTQLWRKSAPGTSLGVKCVWRVGWQPLRHLCRKCRIFDVWKPYRPPRPVKAQHYFLLYEQDWRSRTLFRLKGQLILSVVRFLYPAAWTKESWDCAVGVAAERPRGRRSSIGRGKIFLCLLRAGRLWNPLNRLSERSWGLLE